jgi:hypothetical protein
MFERYAVDVTTSEKNHVCLGEFSKRLKLIYLITHNCIVITCVYSHYQIV